MRFLVTRPQPDCRRTADKLQAAGHVADEAPLLEFRSCPPASFGLQATSALAVTSRRAVTVLARHTEIELLRKLPVFAVGEATAGACRSAGFEHVFTAGGNLKGLSQLICDHKAEISGGQLLYPAAADRSGDLVGLLAKVDIQCRLSVVYSMEPAKNFPAEALSAVQQGITDRVLIFSRRTAEVLRDLIGSGELEHIFSSLPVYAISQQAAEPISRIMRVHVADAPNEKALLDLALAEC